MVIKITLKRGDTDVAIECDANDFVTVADFVIGKVSGNLLKVPKIVKKILPVEATVPAEKVDYASRRRSICNWIKERGTVKASDIYNAFKSQFKSQTSFYHFLRQECFIRIGKGYYKVNDDFDLDIDVPDG